MINLETFVSLCLRGSKWLKNVQKMSKTYKNTHFTGEFYDLFVVSPKKQTQFARQTLWLSTFIIDIYGNIPALEGSKNKANQSQYLRSRRLYLVVRISYLVSRRGMSVFI